MRSLVTASLLAVLAVVAGSGLAACGKSGAASKINEASLDKAKALVHAPQPLADVRPQLVAVLGEPTASEGEDLVWAGVSGSECHYLRLVVSNGTANGTMGGMAHELVESEFAKCAAWAGRK
jgi:hypothetical protein